MRKTFATTLIILFLIISFSCNKCNNETNRVKSVDIKNEDTVKIKIHRYEKALNGIDPKDMKNGLKNLHHEYSFFIPDSAWKDEANVKQVKDFLSDPLYVALYPDCIEKFPDLKDLEAKLGKAFTYFKHYYPEKKIPKVFSYVSCLDYEAPVKYADSVLIISLDMYLGSNYKYYNEILATKYNVPSYVQRRYRKDYILPDCMRAIATTLIDNSQQSEKFIDYVVYQGKILYFLDAMLPDTPDSLKMYYSSSQMDWCLKNEAKVWSYIVDKKVLFTPNTNIIAKLCTDGPFTTVFSRQSPPRVGIWIGWQIVRSYMDNNPKVTLKDLFLDQDAQGILSKAKYKPKK